jgi:hypothetical protein
MNFEGLGFALTSTKFSPNEHHTDEAKSPVRNQKRIPNHKILKLYPSQSAINCFCVDKINAVDASY